MVSSPVNIFALTNNRNAKGAQKAFTIDCITCTKVMLKCFLDHVKFWFDRNCREKTTPSI